MSQALHHDYNSKLALYWCYIFSGGGGGGGLYGLYGEASPKRGTFFTLQVYKRVGISRVEVYERLGKSVI